MREISAASVFGESFTKLLFAHKHSSCQSRQWSNSSRPKRAIFAVRSATSGDEQAHDKVRGKGTFKAARESMAELFELRRRLNQPLPAVIMSTVVCEWTTEVLEIVYDVARDFNALAINYNFRWFLTEDVGQAYERHLQSEFGVKSSGAWRGWLSNNHEKHDYGNVAAALSRVLQNRRRFSPPFVVTTPSQLRGSDYQTYFTDYLNTFGNESCFMPFYWARVHREWRFDLLSWSSGRDRGECFSRWIHGVVQFGDGGEVSQVHPVEPDADL